MNLQPTLPSLVAAWLVCLWLTNSKSALRSLDHLDRQGARVWEAQFGPQQRRTACRNLLLSRHSQGPGVRTGSEASASLVRAEHLPVLSCGKVIAPQAPELDGQLELLLERGRARGRGAAHR